MILYFLGTLVILSKPYCLNRALNLGNSVIPIVFNLLSRYRLYLVHIFYSQLKQSLYLFCIPRYPHYLTVGITAGVIASVWICTSIGVKFSSAASFFTLNLLLQIRIQHHLLPQKVEVSVEERYSGSSSFVPMEMCPPR